MSVLFVLIPLSLVLLGVAVYALFWAVDAGQFDDLDRIGSQLPGDDTPEDSA